jgi:chromosome segregation ATPase
LATTRQELESERAAFQTRVTDYDGRAEEIKKRHQEAEEALKSREGMMEALQGEIIERTGLLEKLDVEIGAVAGEINQATKDLQAVADGKSSKVIGELQTGLDDTREDLSGKQASLAALTAKVDAVKSEVGRLKGELDINQGDQKDLEETRKTESRKSKELEKQLKALRKEEEEKFKALKGLRDQRDELHDLLTNLKTELDAKQELRRGRKHATDDLKVEIATREPKLVEAKERIPKDTKAPSTVPSRERLESRKEILERDRNRWATSTCYHWNIIVWRQKDSMRSRSTVNN